jgi:glucokinase
VFELARAGDKLAAWVIEDACVSLSIGIADVVTLLNPELVILGGGVGKQFDFIADKISAEVRARCRPAVSDAVSFVPNALWDDAALIGGAKLFSTREGDRNDYFLAKFA